MKIAIFFTAFLLLITAPCAQQLTMPTTPEIERYELANLVKNLMIDREKTAGFRGDYFYFKTFVSQLRELEGSETRAAGPEYFPGNANDFFAIYDGRIPLYVRKQRLLAENMKDEYLWRIYVAGPRAMVTNVYIKSQWPVRYPAGASYFSSQGLKLDIMSCEKAGGSDMNYTAYYKVSAPNKFPLLLGVSKSSGSGGSWYSYEITWYGIKASVLGPGAEIGLCEVKD